MAQPSYMSIITKGLHLQMLVTLAKQYQSKILMDSLPFGRRQRARSKTTLSSDKGAFGSNLSKQQTNGNKSRNADKDEHVLQKYVSQPNVSHRHHNNEPAQLQTANDVAFSTSWSKVKSSPAAKKYFKQTFLNNYSSLIEEGEKSRDKRSNDLAEHGNFETKERKALDERDPNERLSEMIPEDDKPRDRRLNIPLTREGRIGKNAYYYTRKMSIFGRQGKIKEAIEIFDHWMMLRDRVMPNKRTFIVLIGILGRVGYSEKAFQLYTKMRHLGLDPEDQVYSGLFNACANSPYPKQALKQAENFLSALQSRGVQLNLITVKAAAKAMAFCGNFPRAFTIVDEASSRLALDTECFDHLLMACVADKQAGFSRALQVWQKMQEFNIQPGASTYNLLIRSARDCGIGDPDKFARVLGLSCGYSQLSGHVNLISSGQNRDIQNQSVFVKEPVSSGNTNAEKDGQQNDIIEKTALGKESHNLFRDVPNFDRDMKEFLVQRDALREKEGSSADMYEWWEEQPAYRQKHHEQQLSLSGQIDWSSLDTERSISETELEILDTAFKIDEDVDLRGSHSDRFKESWETSEATRFHKPSSSFSASDLPYGGESQQLNNTKMSQSCIDAPHKASSFSGQLSNKSLSYRMLPKPTKDNLHENSHSLSASERIPDWSDEAASGQLSPHISDDQLKLTKETLMIKDVKTSAQRLALLGGAHSLITHMSLSGIHPDVRTFSQLVPCLPSTVEAEKDLLCLMEEVGVKPDVDLINDLMMKRNFRHSGHMVKELLPVMSRLGLVPNMRTYAALALTCLKERDAHRLLADMKASNLEPSSTVMGHFIYISRTNFSYKLRMLQKMEWMGLTPVPETIRVIEKSIAITKKNIIAAEKRKDVDSYYLSDDYQESFRKFLHFYKGWLQRITLYKAPHPWKAFQAEDKTLMDEETETAKA